MALGATDRVETEHRDFPPAPQADWVTGNPACSMAAASNDER